MANSAYRLFPEREDVPKDEVEQERYHLNLYNDACAAYNSAQTTLRATAPFMKRDTHQAGLDYLDYVHREIMLPYTILRLEKNDRAKQGCENETDPYERVHGELFDRLDTLLAAMQPEVDALLLEVVNEETEPAAKRSALKKIRQHWHTRTTRHRA